MSSHLAELTHYLREEQQKIDYWRASSILKSGAEIQAELQHTSFTSTETAPLAPNEEVVSRMLSEQLYEEYQRHEPYSTALNVTSGVCSVIALLTITVMVAQFHGLFVSVALGVLAATVVALVGFGLSLNSRQRDIAEKIDNAIDGQFNVRWKELQEQHTEHLAEYKEDQRQQQAKWNESEQRRVKVLNAANCDPESIKSRLTELFDGHRYFSLSSQVVLNIRHLAVDLRIPTLKKVIESKTKAISEKTGKVISRSKSRDEKEFEYKRFAAGTCLSAIVLIFNAAPLCERLSIALHTGDGSKSAYHVCGQINRADLQDFAWATVDPIAMLAKSEFRIEGGKVRKLTSKPEWLERLEQVRIEIHHAD